MKTMLRTNSRMTIPLAMLLVLFLFVVSMNFSGGLKGLNSFFQPVHTIFLAILIESLPFVLIGAFLSSRIHIYVSDAQLAKLIPKRKLSSVFAGALIGFILPVCDCGTMPIARSMLKKGVPLSAVISFVLAAPVINPITLLATYVAFGLNWRIMVVRALCTFSVAVVVGIMAGNWEEGSKPTRILEQAKRETSAAVTAISLIKKRKNPLLSIIDHTVEELFGIYGYLIISAGVASIYEVYHTQHATNLLPQQGVLGVLMMMALAILFSLCSTADAFVARSLSPMAFSIGPILAFMLIGQMADIRNLFFIPKTFGRPMAIKIIGRCFCLCFLIGLFI